MAIAASASTSKPTTTATVRWIHSIQTWGPASSDGRNWPAKHPGQTGQAVPESVARTMTPIVTSTNVVARVRVASRWNRVTGLLPNGAHRDTVHVAVGLFGCRPVTRDGAILARRPPVPRSGADLLRGRNAAFRILTRGVDVDHPIVGHVIWLLVGRNGPAATRRVRLSPRVAAIASRRGPGTPTRGLRQPARYSIAVVRSGFAGPSRIFCPPGD